LFPNTNQPIITGAQPTGDFFYNTPGSLKNDQGDGRVDYRLSDKDNLLWLFELGNVSKTLSPRSRALSTIGGFSGAGEIDLSRNAQISYTARLECDGRHGNPRQLHAPGLLRASGPTRTRICTRSLASAGIIRPPRIPAMAVS